MALPSLRKDKFTQTHKYFCQHHLIQLAVVTLLVAGQPLEVMVSSSLSTFFFCLEGYISLPVVLYM